MRVNGYSLVELVVMVAIAAVLAAIALPRIAHWEIFGHRAFADELAALLRHGQKVAVAQRRAVWINATASEVKACYDPVCTQAVRDPVRGANLSLGVPDGVTLSPAPLSFFFDALGRPSSGVSLTIAGGVTQTLVIEAETGYVHG
ncbi:MAG: hypothetical protein DI596_04625 [Azospira oryzae]|nr:MAG: hypothetical protein DI596_04625 [Azospira oryzae]PZP81226.1 MAG: hypothetical protein DI593_04625 [Azospira oryzae]